MYFYMMAVGCLVVGSAFRMTSTKFVMQTLSGRSAVHMNVAAGTKAEMTPRKELFFNILESGLTDRYPGLTVVPRISKWMQYAKGEIETPVGYKEMHEPCEEFIEGLEALPYWDKSSFEWVAPLEEASKIIRQELETQLMQDELFKGDSKYQRMMGDGWTAFRLQRMGEWNEYNMLRFPLTTKIIKGLRIPLAVRGVMFARQQPGSGVQPHSDGRNFILTCHLGVKVPEPNDGTTDGARKCWLKVAGERHEWQTDKAVVFDTSFQHETGNESTEDRYVLIVDFWHPGLSEEERACLEFIYDARNKFEGGNAASIDCGWVREGKPLSSEAYQKSKQGFGERLQGLFSNGGLVKY